MRANRDAPINAPDFFRDPKQKHPHYLRVLLIAVLKRQHEKESRRRWIRYAFTSSRVPIISFSVRKASTEALVIS